MTKRARVRFAVKEFESGQPFIGVDPYGESLSILKEGFLSLDLPSGMTLAQAEAFADALNSTVTRVGYTAIPEWRGRR